MKVRPKGYNGHHSSLSRLLRLRWIKSQQRWNSKNLPRMSRRRLKVSVEWRKWKWVSTQLKNSSAKTALELASPNTVSCADVLAAATRDLLVMLGGPHFPVFLGRHDGRSSSASFVDGHLPMPSMPISQITQIFAQRGFSVEEMVALSGAHTVGFSHCSKFISEIYNTTTPSSSSYNPRFA